eukprot:15443927-Alexandrium_andersonii.AAC.1
MDQWGPEIRYVYESAMRRHSKLRRCTESLPELGADPSWPRAQVAAKVAAASIGKAAKREVGAAKSERRRALREEL